MLSTMYAMSQCQPNHDDENQYAEITPLVISRGAYCTPQYCFLLLTHSHSHNPYELQSTTSKIPPQVRTNPSVPTTMYQNMTLIYSCPFQRLPNLRRHRRYHKTSYYTLHACRGGGGRDTTYLPAPGPGWCIWRDCRLLRCGIWMYNSSDWQRWFTRDGSV